jgi:hypothetical protein
VAESTLNETFPKSNKNGVENQVKLDQIYNSSSSQSDHNRTADIGWDDIWKRKMIHLQVVDHKTRRIHSMPNHSDTLPARLQLMTYKYLLAGVFTPGEGDFNSIWEALGLDPLKEFSASFQHSVNDLIHDGRLIQRASNLQLLGEAWKNLVRSKNFVVRDELEIIYLMTSSDSHLEEEDRALQFAIEASLLPPKESHMSHQPETEEPGRAIVPSVKGNFPVIGTKIFKFDEKFLKAHIRHVMQYWLGNRSPLGVELEDIARCRLVAILEPRIIYKQQLQILRI